MSEIINLLTPKKSVLQRIADVLVEGQSEEGFVRVTRAYLAKMAGCSEAAVPRALRELANAGVIAREPLTNEAGRSVGVHCEILVPALRAQAERGRQLTLRRHHSD